MAKLYLIKGSKLVQEIFCDMPSGNGKFSLHKHAVSMSKQTQNSPTWDYAIRLGGYIVKKNLSSEIRKIQIYGKDFQNPLLRQVLCPVLDTGEIVLASSYIAYTYNADEIKIFNATNASPKKLIEEISEQLGQNLSPRSIYEKDIGSIMSGSGVELYFACSAVLLDVNRQELINKLYTLKKPANQSMGVRIYSKDFPKLSVNNTYNSNLFSLNETPSSFYGIVDTQILAKDYLIYMLNKPVTLALAQ